MNVPPKTKKKVGALIGLLKEAKSVLIVMQNNPDPDSIASALGLRKIANSQGEAQCTIACGGTVGRAENRALVRYVGLNLRPLADLDPVKFDLTCMVDTQPGTGNNSFPPEVLPDIVIDHHPVRQTTRKCRFTDIRRNYGSTSTILCEYLERLNATLETPLATALLYGIRSDTQDLGREAIKADIDAIYYLYPLANKRVLSQIQRGAVNREYFQMLTEAMKNARVYQNGAIITSLGPVNNPDMIGEVADLFLRDDDVTCTMCYGQSSEKILISIRTSDEALDAGKLIHRVVGRKGTGGGHKTYAGGQIPIAGLAKTASAKLEQQISRKFLKALRVAGHPYTRLIQI
ncbi:MAG TPA: bifunctional oligoribonuclease/PAP phosphatase NrnA [Sedimentisphaerales bacterium]|nr:bifunctional oligoribonuclease/PAP phosphatase NrnA [Sedimentisphaerales bacterium]